MNEKTEEKRARLRAKAEKLIDEYLAWEEENPKPDMTDIEEMALALRKALGQEIVQMAVEEQEERRPVPGPQCKKCNKEMRYKGEKSTEIGTRAGTVQVERGYYYCPSCKERIFPPG